MAGSPSLPLARPAALIATWFGAGLLPKAPGTWGSLAAVPFALLLAWAGGAWLLTAGTVLLLPLGIWASGWYAARDQFDDPGEVVVDEVAGQWIALVPAGLDPLACFLGFVLFRVFDVWKPWPVGWIDRSVKGGVGIMADDLVAGLYAAACVAVFVLLLR
jgi:phosphatidylglycerophosphatase A